MQRQEYNGWTNYETWAVALHIDNEPGTYEGSREIVARSDEEWDAAEALKDWTEEVYILNEEGERPGSLMGDLIGAALSEVNWIEIVRNIRDDA